MLPANLRNIAMHDYQDSATTGQTDRRTGRQTLDKVIPMCRYALQATQKLLLCQIQTVHIVFWCTVFNLLSVINLYLNISHLYRRELNISYSCCLILKTSRVLKQLTSSLRGRQFDSEGGGGWHFLEINILTLKMLEINKLSSSGKKINNLTLTC